VEGEIMKIKSQQVLSALIPLLLINILFVACGGDKPTNNTKIAVEVAAPKMSRFLFTKNRLIMRNCFLIILNPATKSYGDDSKYEESLAFHFVG
jgi:hypothetical protein